jgi:Tol biopolymer transport system component
MVGLLQPGAHRRRATQQIERALLMVLFIAPSTGGQELKRLTKDGRQCFDPVFVKNGSETVYTVLETPTQTSLMRLKIDDGSIEKLHPQATTAEFEPAFAPDGRYFAFVQSRGNLNLKMVIRDTKDSKETIFDPGGGFAGMRRPSFFPDGSRIVISLPESNGQQIATINNQGKDKKLLTATGFNSWPAVSPDGKKIAFGSNRDGDYEIYVMFADGSSPKRLTNSAGMDFRPAWSPDGMQIAFTSNRDGDYEIYVMNADGSNVRRVTNHAERDDHACWHPDGRRLAFVGERGGRFDLYLVEVPK